jgi:hypothetical protein
MCAEYVAESMSANFIRHALPAYDRSQMAKKPPDTRPAAFLRMRRKQRTTA